MKSLFSQPKRKKMILAFATGVFLVVSLFGLGYMYSMPEEAMATSFGGKLDCAFSVGISICEMTPVNHVDAWQSVFASLLPPSSALLALFTFVAIALFLYKKKNNSLSPLVLQKIKIISRRLFLRERGNLPRSPLLELFSRGILNTKIYA
jgi:hypothetical protein